MKALCRRRLIWKNQYNVRIAVEDGGNAYGGNGFEKDGDGTADHIKMDIAGVADAPETGTWNSKTVPVAACTGCKGCTDDGRCYGRQTVRGQPLPLYGIRNGMTVPNEKISFPLSVYSVYDMWVPLEI